VFIDADHSYDRALEDLRLWTPKVRAGGVVCGHDYHNSADPLRCRVRDAVDQWTKKQGISMWFVMAGREHKAFYLWERP